MQMRCNSTADALFYIKPSNVLAKIQPRQLGKLVFVQVPAQDHEPQNWTEIFL